MAQSSVFSSSFYSMLSVQISVLYFMKPFPGRLATKRFLCGRPIITDRCLVLDSMGDTAVSFQLKPTAVNKCLEMPTLWLALGYKLFMLYPLAVLGAVPSCERMVTRLYYVEEVIIYSKTCHFSKSTRARTYKKAHNSGGAKQ